MHGLKMFVYNLHAFTLEKLNNYKFMYLKQKNTFRGKLIEKSEQDRD